MTISSISAVRGFRRAMTVYAATKAAITSLSEGIRIDVMNTPIKVSCIHPGFIRSEINETVEKVPFIVDTETRCKALVKAINKEQANSFVPNWPWSFLHWMLIGIAQLVTGIFHSVNSDSGLNTMLVIKEASVFTVVLPVFAQFNSAKFSYTSTGHLH